MSAAGSTAGFVGLPMIVTAASANNVTVRKCAKTEGGRAEKSVPGAGKKYEKIKPPKMHLFLSLFVSLAR